MELKYKANLAIFKSKQMFLINYDIFKITQNWLKGGWISFIIT